MKAVLTVIGKDKVGIIAAVSKVLSENNVNILDISQTIMQGMFTMIMLVRFNEPESDINVLSGKMSEIEKDMGLSIHIQNEEVFNSMHRI
ncbi:MAG: ACT domain-containing protein [Oscillospiraceae bacterium]|nr:ACT domain-containing protein [Oscillospiraceae bacterium]